MQYRHGIGHAPTNFAFAADTKRKTSVPLFFASTGGLRLPSFMPILHQSLQFIDCYSPSLRRLSQVSGSDCPLTDLLYISRFILLVSPVLRFASLASIGLRLPSSMPILHLSLHLIDFSSSSLRKFASTGGLRLLPL